MMAQNRKNNRSASYFNQDSGRYRRKLLSAVMLGIIVTSLSACMLERFRHEKYSCQNSNLNIAEIIIRNAKKGKQVKIFGYDGDRTGIIKEISSQLAVIQTDDGTLKLNRKTGALSVQLRNRYTRTSCKMSVFTL